MVDKHDLGTLCICAVRYAMGRTSYMPEEIAGIVRGLIKGLEDVDLAILRRDIAQHITMVSELVVHDPASHMMLWVKLRSDIDREIGFREGATGKEIVRDDGDE